jgi:hypothetical protein
VSHESWWCGGALPGRGGTQTHPRPQGRSLTTAAAASAFHYAVVHYLLLDTFGRPRGVSFHRLEWKQRHTRTRKHTHSSRHVGEDCPCFCSSRRGTIKDQLSGTIIFSTIAMENPQHAMCDHSPNERCSARSAQSASVAYAQQHDCMIMCMIGAWGKFPQDYTQTHFWRVKCHVHVSSILAPDRQRATQIVPENKFRPSKSAPAIVG